MKFELSESLLLLLLLLLVASSNTHIKRGGEEKLFGFLLLLGSCRGYRLLLIGRSDTVQPLLVGLVHIKRVARLLLALKFCCQIWKMIHLRDQVATSEVKLTLTSLDRFQRSVNGGEK